MLTTKILPLLLALAALTVAAQNKGPDYTPAEQPIAARMKLRALPDAERALVTRELALEIRKLPAGSPHKLQLASSLANYSTEGDFGRDTLQDVTTTLELALKEQPSTTPGTAHMQLAQLVRYEEMKADLSAPVFAQIRKQLEADDGLRASPNIMLADLTGREWRLANLKGKVVLVNFWATWCPPCRKEMPDLEALYQRFKGKGLIIFAVSDEDAAKVKSFLADKPWTFPILLDPGGKTAQALRLEGVPKTLIYGRDGKLAAQSIDMRTQTQFLGMLAKAGLH